MQQGKTEERRQSICRPICQSSSKLDCSNDFQSLFLCFGHANRWKLQLFVTRRPAYPVMLQLVRISGEDLWGLCWAPIAVAQRQTLGVVRSRDILDASKGPRAKLCHVNGCFIWNSEFAVNSSGNFHLHVGYRGFWWPSLHGHRYSFTISCHVLARCFLHRCCTVLSQARLSEIMWCLIMASCHADVSWGS